MTESVERLHIIRNHLRTGVVGQREVWEEWLAEAAADNERLRSCLKVAENLDTQTAVNLRAEIEQLTAFANNLSMDRDRFLADNEHLRARLYEVDAQLTAEGQIHARECMALRAEKDAEIERLQAALQFYADDCGHTGTIARAALEPKP